MDKALTIENVNITVVAVVIGFFGIIYLTFRRFVDDVKKTVVARMGTNVKVAGFRPGKAPANALKARG